MMTRLKLMIPQRVKSSLRRIKKAAKYYGRERFCPVCSRYSSKFEMFGNVPRSDALCIWCGALERHRFVWLFLQRKTDFFTSKRGLKMLHIAPEVCFESRFRLLAGPGYLTADLVAETVDVKMDITDIGYADETFDAIYCSHVLEHVSDDIKAMTEFRRVLNKGGWAILLVPISAAQTIEDPTITDPNERLKLFGQEDHVRSYGPDYVDRLRTAGFEVSCFSPGDFLSETEIVQMGITKAAGEIYFCQRSVGPDTPDQTTARTIRNWSIPSANSVMSSA
jgi:SAM-dependent methyltransferase